MFNLQTKRGPENILQIKIKKTTSIPSPSQNSDESINFWTVKALQSPDYNFSFIVLSL